MTGLLAALLLVAPAEPGSPHDPGVPESRMEVRTVRLDVQGLPAAEFREDVSLRLHGLQVVDHASLPAEVRTGQLYVRAELRDVIVLTAITEDGRAFDREVDPGDDPPERVAATALANLVFAIQDGRVAADRTGATIPDQAPEEPELPEDPAASSEIDPEPGEPPPSPARWSLGLAVPLGLVIGPGRPTGADVFAGWVGGLGLEGRGPGGGWGRVEFLPTGRTAENLGLLRFRIALGGGWSWRPGPLELAAGALASAEPWIVTRDGRHEPLVRDGSRRTSVLVGAQARLTAGYLHRFSEHRALRLGPWLGLGGAFAVGDGVTVPIVRDDDGRPRLRAGGFELMLGIEILAWLGRAPTG